MSRNAAKILEDDLNEYAKQLQSELYEVEKMCDKLRMKREIEEKKFEIRELRERFKNIKD